jgi:hypothetical protein
MPSPDETFETLRKRLSDGPVLRDTGDDPVYYLVFDAEQMLEVKRSTDRWVASLELDGWEVETLSIAQVVRDAFQNAPDVLRDIWLQEEKDDPLDFETISDTLGSYLTAEDRKPVDQHLRRRLKALEGEENALLLIKDLEALHPYARIGGTESRLQGEFHVPTVIFYPGDRVGEYSLKFLGVHPGDGNYRSVHIGK